MYRGKYICKTLKEVRRKIARANDIVYEPTECRHEGDCLGTCPKCGSRYIKYFGSGTEKLEQELMRHGIRIYSISPYFYCREEKNRHKNQFLFGYGAIPVSEIEDACREFVRVIKNIILEG